MKHVLTTILLAAFATATLSGNSHASGGNANAKILLHLMSTTAKNACTRAMPNCPGIVTHGNLQPTFYYAYVLVTDADSIEGIAGVEFGIDYGSGMSDQTGVDIFGWQLCGTLEFQQPSPVWPSSGGGNLVTWDYVNACQRTVPPGAIDPAEGVVANAGYFYLGSYGDATMHITIRPVSGYAKVANCQSSEDVVEGPGVLFVPSHLGYIGFGGQTGFSPCGLTPVANTTWSGLKSLYNNNR